MAPRQRSTGMSPQAIPARANQALTDFIADLDPRAVLWMYSNIEDTPLDQLVAAQVDQLRQALAMRTEIDVRAWNANVLEFLGGADHHEGPEGDKGREAGVSTRRSPTDGGADLLRVRPQGPQVV